MFKNHFTVLETLDTIFDRFFDTVAVEKVGDTKIDTSDERKAFDSQDEKEEVKEGEEKEGEENEEVVEEEEKEGEEKEEEVEEEEDETGEEEGLAEDSLYQALKKDNPDILKKYPALRSTIFREAQYTELLPTIEDAKNAVEAAETLSGLQADIESGQPGKFLKAVKELGDDAFNAFLGNFTTELHSLSKDAYLEFMYPEFKKMLRIAAKNKDENIANSAANIHYFLFEDTDFNKEVGLKATKADPREDKVTQREKEFAEKQANSFTRDIVTTSEARLKRMIMAPLANSGLSKLRSQAIENEIFRRVDIAVTKDARHMGNIRHLYNKAKAEDFTTEGKDRIINAYLSRAKVLISKYRQQVLTEEGLTVKEPAEKKVEEKPTRIPSSNSGKQQGIKPGQKVDPTKVDWNKTSERDMLEGRVTMKS